MMHAAASHESAHCLCLISLQVAVLLAPVAYVTHVDSAPLLTLATFNTDEVWRVFAVSVVPSQLSCIQCA